MDYVNLVMNVIVLALLYVLKVRGKLAADAGGVAPSLKDLALKVLHELAARRFPEMPAASAVERFLVEHAHHGFFYDDLAKENAAAAAAEPEKK